MRKMPRIKWNIRNTILTASLL